MTRALAVVCALVALTACKKEDKKTDEPAATSVNKANEPAAAQAAAGEAAPPAAPPPGSADDLCGGAADDFGKLDLAAAPADGAAPAEAKAATPGAADAPKVDPAAIPKDGIPTMQVRGFAGVEPTGFRVSYAETSVPLHAQLVAILKEVRLYEEIATALNSTIKLPRTIDIQIVDCGMVNAFYDPNGSRIIMCNELMSYFAEMFKPIAKTDEELGNAILGATIFAFFHEAGHGLIHQLDLPSTGREEDAVDQFATLILIAGGDDAVKMALAGAYWFQLQAQQGNETPFYDEHAFDAQRFYNILCWIYGADPQARADFVASGTLPEARAARCPEEFARTKRAWEKLLEPHLTDEAARNAEIEASAPPPPPPPASGTTCEAVAEKVALLIIGQVEQELEGATQEQIAAAVKELEVQIPQFVEQAVEECRSKNWPESARQCVMKASTLDAASQCGV